MRCAPTTAALVEEDDVVGIWIEELALLRVRSATGTTVQEDDRFALGITGLLDIEGVAVSSVEKPCPEWLYVREELVHRHSPNFVPICGTPPSRGNETSPVSA